MTALVVVVAAVFGAVVGSFLNVVISRVPRHESIVWPPSHCPHCGSMLRPAELVPIVSWVALRGRCRTCGAPIPVRYPLVEAACAIVAGLVAYVIVA